MNWLFDEKNLKETPSILDSLDVDTEKRYRNEGVDFIRNLCDRLGLRHITMSTACVLFHRFYMLKSFKLFSRWEIASACLFLAGKTEETPKKSKDVFNMTKSMLIEIGRVEESTRITQDRFLAFELILLQTLKFDLYVRQPYSHLLVLAQKLKGEKDIINEIVQMAWSFLNDSLYIPLCVVYPPELIALACLYLAFSTKVTQLNAKSNSLMEKNLENVGRIMDKNHPKEWWTQCIHESIPYSSSDNKETNDTTCTDVVVDDRSTQKYHPGSNIIEILNIEDICNQIKTLYDESVFNIQIDTKN